MLNPSMYTLANGGAGLGMGHRTNSSPSHSPSNKGGLNSTNNNGIGPVSIDDRRWKFQDESQLPKPRDFIGGARRYRAGRGSSVPLDLSALG